MPVETVFCTRLIDAAPQDVWAVLRTFDLGWHPFVTACTVRQSARSGIVREFETSDGGRLVERCTYLSDVDRVLCYTALSGIAGAEYYVARVEVQVQEGACVVNWSAEIVAGSDRVHDIADGTRAVFEAGLDALGRVSGGIVRPATVPENGCGLVAGSVGGVPRLSYLTGDVSHSKSGTLVLFLHGIGGQASNWAAQIAAFGSEYRVAAMNFRGYGGSALGPSQSQIDGYCDDINRMAAHFRAARLVLVGLSMGSWIATSFAMRYPEKLAALVLAGGCTGMSEADPDERKRFRASREVPLSQGQRPADFSASVVDVIAGPNASDEVRMVLHKSMSDIPSETYRDALRCFCNPTEVFDFAQIACPVLMVTGAHDRLAPPSEIREVSVRIFDAIREEGGVPDVRFEILADAGHVCNLEQADAFNAVLSEFLGQLPEIAVAYKPSREEKQREKQARILAAAQAEFCRAGFDGASMDRLAKAADVSKPTLYKYFGDKEGLFEAVLEAGRAHIVAPLHGGAGALVERLWRFSWTYAKFVLRPDMLSLARLILGEAARRPASAITYHQNGPARAFEGLVAFVTAAEADGALQVSDPKRAANDLWSLILSGSRDHYLHHADERPSQAELVGAIGHGLRVFLTVYSTEPETDLAALEAKIAAYSGVSLHTE